VAAAVGQDVDTHDVTVIAGERIAVDLELPSRDVRPSAGTRKSALTATAPSGNPAQRRPASASSSALSSR
jgi:hypothetical protein